MERVEKPKQERDVGNDKHTFLEAVKRASVEEIQTSFDATAILELAANLTNTKLFVLGETHGVKENTNVIYTLFKKFGFRQLALEWEPRLMAVVNKFLESGELDFDAIKDSPDGRITADHFALVKKLKLEGMLDKLVCFDEGTGGPEWDERDAAMARNILANLANVPTLAIAGNLHTKTDPITFDDEPDKHHPMGEDVKQSIPNVATGKIEYLGGQYHNFGIKDFRGSPEAKTSLKARFYRNANGLYMFEIPEAHAASVPNPNERI